MKLIRTLLFISLLFPAFRLSAQCGGDFTWTFSGSTVSFTGMVTLNTTNVVWEFGDGNFDYSNNIAPTHTYAGPGPYTACIIVYDSLQPCADSTCHTIVLDSCAASFTSSITGTTGNFYGFASGGSPNSVYVWNFGDSSPSVYTQNPTHTFPGPGIYNVCFAYYDLVTNCDDSICMPVTVGGCNADFTWIDSLGYVFFINNSSPGNAGVYFWDFGDGNFSSQQHPSNQYANSGTYMVCLTVLDSNQNFCDSTCQFITTFPVAGMEENNFNISSIALSPNPSDASATCSFFMRESAQAAISVYDIAGREVVASVNNQFSAGKQQVVINTQDFAPGIYFVQINVNGQSVKSKLIVSHQQ